MIDNLKDDRSNMLVVSKRLGRLNPSLISDIYTHLYDKLQDEAARGFTQVMGEDNLVTSL
jgi:hypothetical protein